MLLVDVIVKSNCEIIVLTNTEINEKKRLNTASTFKNHDYHILTVNAKMQMLQLVHNA